MKRTLQLRIYFTLIILITGLNWLRGEVISEHKSEKKLRPSYLKMSTGSDISSFRDFATSPLVYKGVASNMSLFYIRLDSKRQTDFGIEYILGKYDSKVNDEKALSSISTINGSFSKLYGISGISGEKLNFKVGGLAIITGNFRTNPSLQNNSVGMEGFFNLMGSAKSTLDVSRTQAKSGKILGVFNYHRQPRTKNLSFRLDVGLINSNLRNGYAYTIYSPVLNDPNLFDGYEFNAFDGFRMSTSLDYTILLKNKNAICWSYLWDGYQTGGELNQLECVHHKIRFSLLFGLKE